MNISGGRSLTGGRRGDAPWPAPAARDVVPPAEEAMPRLAERYAVPLGALDGWAVAVNLTRSGCRFGDPGLRAYAEHLAAGAVLARAARLLGPLRAATQLVREPLREPFAGELDVDATVENTLGKPFPEAGDWVVARRQERRHQVVLMVDASLSMSGENAATAAVAAAVLCLKLRPEDVAVVVFADTARAVTRLESADPPEEVVRRMLNQPYSGYTNIAAALEMGAAELERGRNPRRSGLLITDGVVTAGRDPLPLAHRFARLFVLLTEDYKMNPELCRRLADAGHGDVFPVAAYRDLPARLLSVANRVLR